MFPQPEERDPPAAPGRSASSLGFRRQVHVHTGSAGSGTISGRFGSTRTRSRDDQELSVTSKQGTELGSRDRNQDYLGGRAGLNATVLDTPNLEKLAFHETPSSGAGSGWSWNAIQPSYRLKGAGRRTDSSGGLSTSNDQSFAFGGYVPASTSLNASSSQGLNRAIDMEKAGLSHDTDLAASPINESYSDSRHWRTSSSGRPTTASSSSSTSTSTRPSRYHNQPLPLHPQYLGDSYRSDSTDAEYEDNIGQDDEDIVVALHDYTPPNRSNDARHTKYSGSLASAQTSAGHDSANGVGETSKSQVYLTFNVGDHIRVWNRHDSGWWDGELLDEIDTTDNENSNANGDKIPRDEGHLGSSFPGSFKNASLSPSRPTRRGWFPSNFVQSRQEYQARLESIENGQYDDFDIPQADTSGTTVNMSRDSSQSTNVVSQRSRSDRPRRPSEATSDVSYQSTASSSSEFAPRNNPHALSMSGSRWPARSQSYSATSPPIPEHSFRGSRFTSSADLGNTHRAIDGDRQEGSSDSALEVTLEPITQAVSLVYSAVHNHRHAHYQPATACVISAIRSLLSATGCLARESPLLAQSPQLAKLRKTILADLADLVALAKSASQTNDEDETAGMVKASQETRDDVRIFLQHLVELGHSLPERKEVQYPLVSSRTSSSSSTNIRKRSPPKLTPLDVESASPRDPYPRSAASASMTSLSSIEDSAKSRLPVNEHGKLDVLSSIGQTEESLFSIIASLIGHTHSHTANSHPSSHATLIDLTRETIENIKDLLTIVEAVVKHPEIAQAWPAQVHSLQAAKAAVYDVTGRLVECAEIVAQSSTEDGHKADLLSAATSVLRTGSECARLVRTCARRRVGMGTFDIDLDSQPSSSQSMAGYGPSLSLPPSGEGKKTPSFLQAGLLSPALIEERSSSPQEDEEEELMTRSDEDVTVQPRRPSFLSTQTSPHLQDKAMLTPAGRRHRALSYASPSTTPRLTPRRSPSKSADLNVEGDFEFQKTPKPSDVEPEAVTKTPLASRHERDQQVPSDSRLWLLSHDYNPRDIVFGSDGSITAASLDVLVEKLTPHDSLVDPAFVETFFLTFRLFTTPAKFLEAVELRFDASPPIQMPLNQESIRLWNDRKLVPIRLRILKLIKAWLESHWRQSDHVILDALITFTDERLGKAFPNEGPRLKDTANKLKTGSRGSHSRKPSIKYSLREPALANHLPPTPIMNKTLFSALRSQSKTITITDFNATELARQMTLLEAKMFVKIAPEDLLSAGKQRPESLSAMSTLSNRITGWVADSILDETDAKKRAALLKFFIKLANRCLELDNFSTLFAILAGLNSSTISRLHKTWTALPPKYRNIMESLRNLIDHSRNHRNYRNRLRESEPPCLPFLGLILTDVTFTNEGNPNLKPSPQDASVQLINFDKYSRLSRIAVDFQRFQTPYNLAILPDVQSWLDRVLAEKGSGSVDALYRKSCQ